MCGRCPGCLVEWKERFLAEAVHHAGSPGLGRNRGGNEWLFLSIINLTIYLPFRFLLPFHLKLGKTFAYEWTFRTFLKYWHVHGEDEIRSPPCLSGVTVLFGLIYFCHINVELLVENFADFKVRDSRYLHFSSAIHLQWPWGQTVISWVVLLWNGGNSTTCIATLDKWDNVRKTPVMPGYSKHWIDGFDMITVRERVFKKWIAMWKSGE